MEWYIVNIEFENLKYNEEGNLIYKVKASYREEAEQKVNKFIREEKEKDRSYNYIISSMISLNSLDEIE